MRGIIVVFIGSIITFAFTNTVQPGDESLRENPDVVFIKQWHMEQKAAEVAGQLHLSQAQIQTLRDVKAQMEQIKAESESQKKQTEAQLAQLAKQIRGQIEQNGEVDDNLEKQMRGLRHDLRQLREATRLRIRLAGMPLKDLLSDDQRAALEEHRGSQREHRGKREHVRVARFLLSDAFLNQFQ